MSQTHTVGKFATKISTHGGNTMVRYHSTDVVEFNAGWIMLHTGGWKTATTKLRMNQTSSQFNLGYRVYQHNFAWYVDLPNGEVLPFGGHDWVAFSRNN